MAGLWSRKFFLALADFCIAKIQIFCIMSLMAKLETTREVVEALGGRHAVAKLFGLGATAVDHWENGKFPAHTYLEMVAELTKRGHEAPAELWKFRRTWSSRERESKPNETAA